MTVSLTGRARRDLRRIEAAALRRVMAALARFDAAREGDVKKLRGIEGEYRLRVGEYRVRFALDSATSTVLVLRVLPRSEAYR
jgi:mRNA interferase RelE/StbE